KTPLRGRPDCRDLGKTRFAQNPQHVSTAAQTATGRRRCCRIEIAMCGDRVEEDPPGGVFPWRRPRRDWDPPIGPQDSPPLRQRSDRFGYVMDAEIRDDGVERTVGEWHRFRIA